MNPQLDELEQLCFNLISREFFIPLHQVVTLDDDLVGTRARYNQLKALSVRKADKEGHIADVVADS